MKNIKIIISIILIFCVLFVSWRVLRTLIMIHLRNKDDVNVSYISPASISAQCSNKVATPFVSVVFNK